ncbi:MAG: hypothetical protein PHR45_01330 [Muribaculaceae bacterium]|nr:hypothetical protein [Muribaculaceae bacterium]
MKKQLLFGALALAGAVALAPEVEAKSAMDACLKMEWMNTDVVPINLDARQGVAKDGNFYLQNKAKKVIEVWNETGKVKEIASGEGTNITLDDAGNIIVRLGTFNTNYVNTRNELRIIPADGSAVVDIPLSGIPGNRVDFWGHVRGNVMDKTKGGTLYMGVTWYPQIIEIPIIGGAQDVKNTYSHHYTSPFGISGNISTTTLMSGWEGVEDLAVLSPHIDKTKGNSIEQMKMDEELSWLHNAYYITPRHNGCTGYSIFKVGDQKFIVYSTGGNNGDGFTVSKLATKNVSAVEDTDESYRVGTKYAETNDDGNPTYANNAFYANHFSVDPISDTEAYIYQYFPKGYIAKYKFTYTGAGVESVNDEPVYQVMALDGKIVIEGEASDIRVFNVSGALISEGQTTIETPSGIYIVMVNGKATKVRVK